jgi:MFS family permease
VQDTRGHARREAALHHGIPTDAGGPSVGEVFKLTSWTNRSLFATSQAGLVNNLNDGMAWGLFPLFFAAGGLRIDQVAILAALYPGVWGLAQLGTGALSDHLGRKPLIVGGMIVQALGIFLIIASEGFRPWALGAVILGLGTAMVYPTLLAAIGDVAHPAWRASSVGVYRLWRDGGYAIGALLTGVVADLSGLRWAIGLGGVLTLASGIVVAAVMAETLGATRRAASPVAASPVAASPVPSAPGSGR